MSKFYSKIIWKRGCSQFNHENFSRDHHIIFNSGISVEASSAPEYSGNPQLTNPEEIFAANVSSCHMLTFLAIAAKSRFIVEDYQDDVEAELGKNEENILCMTKVTLKPKVTFSGEQIPDSEKLKSLHEKAHKHCFIANSIKTPVSIEIQKK